MRRLGDDEREARVGKIRQIKRWVEDLLALGPDTAVMVTELACTEPGCPPLETVIAVLGPASREQRKLHRPVADVTHEEVVDLWGKTDGDHHHDDGSGRR
jgi:hypothetical protein